ncbi:MAG: ABC transporter permease subunit [Bacteroidetes bacterium]|nr:ABC transporter permease subunit [Bacteroidota bacterium]
MPSNLSALNATAKKFFRNPLATIGLAFIALCALIALSGYLIVPDKTHAANQMFLEISLRKPGFSATILNPPETASKNGLRELFAGREDPGSSFLWDNSGDTAVANVIAAQESYGKELNKNLTQKTFWLGTDVFGRDVLSRLLLGTRISLSVGLISVFISLVLGILLGMIAGYYRGWVDKIVMWLINVIWSLPTLLLVIAITFALGKGFWQIFVAVGITMWVELARIVRGQVFSLREREFIQAARMLGFSDFRIMFKHILPNLVGPIVVIAAANFASAILLEAGLSFLGLGVQPPMPSWGQMLNENYAYIYANSTLNAAHLALAPGIAIMLLVMSFNFVGNGLRDALDAKM